MATKKRTAKNASSKKAVRPKFRTFKVAPTPRPFMAFRVTDQTVYWALISLIILALGMWVIYLQVKINEVYDQVDSNTYQLEFLPEDTKHSKNTN